MRTDRTQRGATIIEFGLVAFIFFLVMWGIFEFARAFYVVNTTQHLTRCIARSAVVTLPSQHEAAKMRCLMPTGGSGTTWPFFTLGADDLTSVFRLKYIVRTVSSAGTVVSQIDDTDVTGTNVPDDQVSACVAQVSCVTQVVAYFDTSAGRNPVATLGLFAAWIGSDQSYAGVRSETTMPAESMSWQP